VLLDEPIAHQDPRHQGFVLQRLLRHRERTFVASMHDLNGACAFATHALLLSGRGDWSAGPAGQVLVPAPLAELFGTPVRAVALDDGRRVLVTG
jgi:iron complex transport system ATP-binding protein